MAVAQEEGDEEEVPEVAVGAEQEDLLVEEEGVDVEDSESAVEALADVEALEEVDEEEAEALAVDGEVDFADDKLFNI